MKRGIVLFAALMLVCALPATGSAMDKWDIALYANGRPLYAGEQGSLSLVKERLVLALEPLNRDRVQTYVSAEKGAEWNGILGLSPNRLTIEGYFALVHFGMYALDDSRIPKWIPVLMYDSVRYTEEAVTDRNDDISHMRATGSFFPVEGKFFRLVRIGYTWEW